MIDKLIFITNEFDKEKLKVELILSQSVLIKLKRLWILTTVSKSIVVRYHDFSIESMKDNAYSLY